MKGIHPQIANFVKKQKEEEWSYLPSFLKSKPQKQTGQIKVQSLIFDSYPKKYNETRKCCIVCETKGIKIWDCDDNAKVEELFSYPVDQNVIPLYAKFRKQYPPILYFITNKNQLVSIQIKDSDVIATSFFSYNYCDFDIENDLLFAFTNDCQLHIYDISNTQALLIEKTQTVKYMKDSHPIALSSAYLAYPTYETPETYNEPPESTAAKTQETITNSINWLTEGVKTFYSSNQSQQPKKQEVEEEDIKKEFVLVVDYRDLAMKKEVKKVSHFCATSSRIRRMKFSPRGDLLAVADEKGYLTNVFRIYPNGDVHHLFILKRGTSIATITDLSFSIDSEIFVMSSSKTSHVFKLPLVLNDNYTRMNTTIISATDTFNTASSGTFIQGKQVDYNMNQQYESEEKKEVQWINSAYKIHSNVSNDNSITTTFNDNKLIQGVSHQLQVYDYFPEKYLENGYFNIDKPCDCQYINTNLFQLQTKIGDIDDYKTLETRLIPFDKQKIKQYRDCENVFAIGNEQIEKQKMKLEENMNQWISATEKVFDVDYCISIEESFNSIKDEKENSKENSKDDDELHVEINVIKSEEYDDNNNVDNNNVQENKEIKQEKEVKEENKENQKQMKRISIHITEDNNSEHLSNESDSHSDDTSESDVISI